VTEPEGLHIGIVGLRFGAEFLPIYQRHPAVSRVSIADTDEARLARVGDTFGVAGRYGSLDALLADPDVDAVHVATPVSWHAGQAVAVLEAGKHCACAVPMATAIDDLHAIIRAQEASGRQYMMMETTVFSREFLYVKQLLDSGRLGDLTFYRGFHMQDLDGFPPYWEGYPPMHYITHALSPALALADTTAQSVRCLGSSHLTEARRGGYGNPFPLEAALLRLREHPMAVDITMSFFQTARAYTEGFAVYGTRMGVEWPTAEGGPLLVHELGPVRSDGRGRAVSVTQVDAPDRADLLPEEIALFTRPVDLLVDQGSVAVGASHGGSHPHLVHEFVSSIYDDRPPRVDARVAAAWSAPGICAHESALAGGEAVDIPDFAP
jgi:predicted dehydrogenase